MRDLTQKFIPHGEIVAENISAEEFLTRYADSHHEWVQGVVIKMSPATQRHNQLMVFFTLLFGAYFDRDSIGKFFVGNFTMRMATSMRDPDILVILNNNPHPLTNTFIRGAGDLCIEIVSPDSVGRDYEDKLGEYETAGVREYWLIDPLKQLIIFYQLQPDGKYLAISPDAEGCYRSAVLPKLKIYVPTLFQEILPGFSEVGTMVKAMLE